MDYHFTATSGSSIYVEDVGAGPPILAVHGLGGGAYFFRGFAARLEGRHRVLTVDLPGTGRSTSGQPFSTDTWVADLGDLVAAKIGAPVVFVGHSFGAILALKSWRAWPQWVRALVFVGGLPQVRPLIRERLSQRIAAVTRSGSLAGWGAKVVAGVFAPETLVRQTELVSLFERLFETQEPMVYVRAAQALLDATARAIVPAVDVPCLAVTGAQDQYAPPEDVRVFVRDLQVECGLEVIPDCGHVPFLEAPDKFATVVGDFMKTIERLAALRTSPAPGT